MRCLKLPFQFDPERLRADLALVQPAEWIPHVNRKHYDGQWSGAGLRSIGGSTIDLGPEAHGTEQFRDTALLGRCAYFREVLATFRCPLLSVRLLKLHAGSNIAEHVDHALDFDDGEVRLHVPIVTSDAVKFFLDGSRLVMAPGECWYTNVNLPHSVENRGLIDRVHLVADCRVDDWLRSLFASTPRSTSDRFTARIELPATAVGGVVGLFSATAATPENAARRVSFRAEGTSLILSWPESHTWQLRAHLNASDVATAPAPTVLRLESSPDPERRHRSDCDALLARFRATFPTCAISEEVTP